MDLILKPCVTLGRSPEFTVSRMLMVLEDKNLDLIAFEFDLWSFVISSGDIMPR